MTLTRAKVNAFIEAADNLLGQQQAELLRLGISAENRKLAEAYIEARLELLHALTPRNHLAGQAGQDRREDRPARAIDHVPDGRGDGLARVVSGDP
jgi:hypothetical protein